MDALVRARLERNPLTVVVRVLTPQALKGLPIFGRSVTATVASLLKKSAKCQEETSQSR